VRGVAGRLTVLAVSLTAVVATGTGERSGAAAPGCPERQTGAAYAGRVHATLLTRRDLWGERLLARPGGPTYAAAAGPLRPLLLARAAGKRPLTDSGVYYLPFGSPAGTRGATSVALHVADGSQIVSRRIGGRSLTVSVGAGGRERYGSCLARLTPARLAGGWLPILRTRYVDAGGVRYEQESFATRVPGRAQLVSFVRISVDARGARADGGLRVAPSAGGRQIGMTRVRRGTTVTVHATWVVGPGRLLVTDRTAYEEARRALVASWQRRLTGAMTLAVPEPRIQNAARALQVQSLVLTWRYSVGNQYEQFSFPEGVDVAQVLAEQGFADVAGAILRVSLTRKPEPYANWKRGEKLLGFATHWRLHRDTRLLAQATPALAGYVAALGRQLERNPNRLLDRERYSSDIPDAVYGLHSQAIVWAGLRGIADAWRQTGRRALAARADRLAVRLEAGLRRAVASSKRPLPDGSLFVPVRLLDSERPYASVTEERAGSYWNLVAPYAFATGLLAPGSADARGVLRYLERHGAHLLGVVRSGGYALYGLPGERDPSRPTGAINAVYGINTARFLADNDQADRLVLGLYGQLAAAMTPHTFVSGEAASVAPLPGTAERAMYLPPNGASNAAFLETLRLLLVHETRDPAGEARGLRLAWATPRAWLEPGRRIAVERAPTSFGPVSFSIEAAAHSAAVTVEAPRRARPRSLTLTLRLAPGKRIASVRIGGRAYRRFDPKTGTIDLSGRSGSIRLAVVIRGEPQ
jgi:hypothetical protein